MVPHLMEVMVVAALPVLPPPFVIQYSFPLIANSKYCKSFQYCNYTEPAHTILSGDTHDREGTIKFGQFYAGNTFIGFEENAPYYRSWKHVPAGDYVITAK